MTSLAASTIESLSGLATPFTAVAVCSGPPTEHLDVARLVTTDENRWSAQGEPTIYLAGDVGTALAEVGRHWDGSDPTCLWNVRLELGSAVDLRTPTVRAAIGVPDDPRWYLDRDRCRDIARQLRRAGSDGMVVPSVAMLDDMERWNAVVFVDRITSVQRAIAFPCVVAEIGSPR